MENRAVKPPPLPLMWFGLLLFIALTLGSAAFALFSVPPGSRNWMASLLVAVGTCSFLVAARLTSWGLRIMREGPQMQKSSTRTGALAGLGAVAGAALWSALTTLPGYWVLSTAWFAFLCGCALRYLPYLHDLRASAAEGG
jgi:hypothetical protein